MEWKKGLGKNISREPETIFWLPEPDRNDSCTTNICILKISCFWLGLCIISVLKYHLNILMPFAYLSVIALENVFVIAGIGQAISAEVIPGGSCRIPKVFGGTRFVFTFFCFFVIDSGNI